MVNIEPYNFQKKTNVKEHNDIVDKINEIVNVINNEELEGIGSRLDTIDSTDALQWRDIDSIKAKNTEQDNKLADNTKVLAGVIDSLVSNVDIMNGTTTGNIKVRIERENAPSIDSDDYNIQKPTSVELVQGSAPAMVKAQITLSDGTALISDDFMFTTEAIGQDVYISSFVFKNGNVAGTISADIGLSNGTTLEANNFAVPTDPNVTSSITDLQNRMTAVESADVGELATLKTTVAEHTVAITALDNDVADMMISKADVDNINQVIVSKQIDLDATIRLKGHNEDSTKFVNYGIVGGSPTNPFTVTQETEAFGQLVDKPIGTIALLDSNGRPKNFTSGGEVWEEVDLNNWPTDWVEGDKVKSAVGVGLNSSVKLYALNTTPIFYEFTLSNKLTSSVPIHIDSNAITYYFWSTVNKLNTENQLFSISRAVYGDTANGKTCTVSDLLPFASNIHILRLKK